MHVRDSSTSKLVKIREIRASDRQNRNVPRFLGNWATNFKIREYRENSSQNRPLSCSRE